MTAKLGDEAAMDKYFAEDIKYICPEGTVTLGRDNLKKNFADKLKDMGKIDMKSTVEHVIEQGDLTVDIGSFEITPKQEAETRRHRREAHARKMTYMSVWKKTGDSRQVIAHGTWEKKEE